MNEIISGTSECVSHYERALIQFLANQYDEYRCSPEFGALRQHMALVEMLNKMENAKREALLKAAYHHPFFSGHRHLTSVRVSLV